MTETVKLDAARPNGEPLEPTAPALLAERVARAIVFAEAEVPEAATEAVAQIAELAGAEDLPGMEDAMFVLADVPEALAELAKQRRQIDNIVAAGERGHVVMEGLRAAKVNLTKLLAHQPELRQHADAEAEWRNPDRAFGYSRNALSLNQRRERADKLAAAWWGGEEPEALAAYRADVVAAVRAERARLLADPVVVAQVDVASATVAMERLTADRKVVSPEVAAYVAAAIRKALAEQVLAEAAKPKRKK